VRDRRKFLGKTAVGHAPQPFRMEREPRDRYVRLFGTKSEPDQVLARRFGRPVSAVRHRRAKKRIRVMGIPFHNPHYETWNPDELALLGKLPDEEVARRTGHSLTSVRHARNKRHILSVRQVAPEWRPEEEALLGAGPDAAIEPHC
jgi:hypothetical protein